MFHFPHYNAPAALPHPSLPGGGTGRSAFFPESGFVLSDVGVGNYTIIGAVTYVALHLPARAYELFPVSELIGTLFALSQFVVSSEFTVMRLSPRALTAP